jgi:CubicO group peptidase (beta-lactamase class C family)
MTRTSHAEKGTEQGLARGWPALAGAGALRSTANDMMRFLDACQGRRKTDLSPAIANLPQVRW